MRTDNRYTYCK